MNKKMLRITALITCLCIGASFTAFAENEEDTQQQSEAADTVFSDIDEAGQQPEAETDENTVNLYVNPRTQGEENVYRTLEQAIDAVKKIDREKMQVIVNIEGGTYDISSPLVLDKTSSGSEKYPVIYRAAEGKEVIINAGKRVTGEKLSDSDRVKSKIPQNVRNKVYKIDLSDMKQNQLGNMDAMSANMGSRDVTVYGDFVEIIYDEDRMPRASYPNIGSEYIEQANSTTVFTLENKDIPIESWDIASNLGWMDCIEHYGYTYGRGNLIGYDAATKMIIGTIVPGFSYGVGGRIRFKNLPEFIDQPGEYSIDFTNRCVYFYPPDEHFQKTAYVTSCKVPIVQFNGVSNVVLDGIKIQNGGNDGMKIDSSSNCTIKNCTVKNVSGCGIKVLNSKNIKIDSCSINNIGLTGIYIEGAGDHKTLTSSGNSVEGCDIYTIGTTAPTGSNGILTKDETGTKIIGNRVHDVTHAAIELQQSTACTIERNEVYNAANDTYDAGALYCGGRTFKGTGNIYKENYIHDNYLTSDAKSGAVMAMYWDDQQSGNTAVDNIFDDNQFCMLVGGGDWNTVENNIFYSSRASLTLDARGESWQSIADGASKVSQYESEVGVGNKVWEEKYPYTTKLYNYAKENNMAKINAPDESIVRNNIMIKTPGFSMANSAVVNAIDISNNERKSDDFIAFENPDNYDFYYSKESSPSGYDYIDFSKIGIGDKQPGKAILTGPRDGATEIEGNNVVLSWKDTGGADRYRVRISMDKSMKALIYDEVVKGKRVQLDDLKYGKTFYWTVQPVKSSKSESDGIVSEVSSFTTSKTEKKDTTKLNKLLTELGNSWRRVTEGKRPGMYKEGSIAALDKVVTEAETVYYNNATKMFTVKNVTAKLQNAINSFNDSLVVETIEMGDWLKDKQGWTKTGADKINGEVMHLINTTDGGSAGYEGAQLTRGQMLKFKAKIDLTNFQMWSFNGDVATGSAWGKTGYSIVVKRDVFEIQRRMRKNGELLGETIKTFKNEESIMTSDVWHTVETGVLSTVLGPRIILKVDGKTAVDYIDESEYKTDELGYFVFTEASGGIGMSIAPSYYEGE